MAKLGSNPFLCVFLQDTHYSIPGVVSLRCTSNRHNYVEEIMGQEQSKPEGIIRNTRFRRFENTYM